MVLQHCPNIKEFWGSHTSITVKFLSDRSFVDQSAHESFREKIQVTLWYFSTARTSRSSRQPAPASLVRFPDRSFAKSPVRFLDLSFADSPLTHLSAKILQVTSPSWPIASRCRCLSPRNAPASLVRFPERSFADRSADTLLRDFSSR